MRKLIDFIIHFLPVPGYILLFLMLMYPMVLKLLYLKAALFALLLVLVGFKIGATGRTSLHHNVFFWSLFVSLVGLSFCVEGFVAGGPGALKEAQVYFFWVLVYALLIGELSNWKVIEGIQQTLILATFCISFNGIIFALMELGFVPHLSIVEMIAFGEDEVLGRHQGFIELNVIGLNSLPFLVPYTMAMLYVHIKSRRRLPYPEYFVWLTFLLATLVTMLSGRRAIMLGCLLAPFLISFFWLFSPQRENRAQFVTVKRGLTGFFWVIFMCFLLSSIYNYNSDQLLNRFLRGFEFSGYDVEYEAEIRKTQFFSLLHTWEQNPLFGRGLGTTAYDFISSDNMPWSYELYYLALLAQTGIVGILAYGLAILWVYWKGIQTVRKGGDLGVIMIANLVGMTALLIASGTNPYLARFDGLWVIFLPLALINFSMLFYHPMEEKYGPC